MISRFNIHIKYRKITFLLFYYLLQIRYYNRGATDSAGAGASPPFAARWFIPRLTAWAHRTARHSTHGPSRSNGVGVADLGGPPVSEVECPQQVTLPYDRRVGPACRRGRDFGLVRAGKVLLGRTGCLRSS
jgi:hypothetical protein